MLCAGIIIAPAPGGSNFRGMGLQQPRLRVKVARNVSITFATSLLSSGATAVGALVVAHELGARGAGLFTLARVVPTVVAGVLGGGITIANPYFIGGRRHSVQAIAETNVVLGLVFGLLGLGAWILAGPLLMTSFYKHVSAWPVVILGASVPILLMRNYLNSIQQGLQAFTEANLVLLVEDLGGMLCVIPLLWKSPAAGTVDLLIILAPLVGATVSLVVAVWDLTRRGIRLLPGLRPAFAVEMLRFGIKGHLARIANTLSWRLDMMILSTLGSAEAVGYYAVATKIAETVRPLSGSLNFVLRPLFASLPAQEARTEGVRLLRSFFAVNFLAVTLLWLMSGIIIDRLFGPDFAAAIPACRILLVGLVAFGVDGVLNGFNVGTGRPEFNAYAAVVGLVITLAGDLTLITRYGLMGAAVTSAVAYTAKGLALAAIFVSLTARRPESPRVSEASRRAA